MDFIFYDYYMKRKELITRKRHACARVLDKPYPQWEGPFSPNRVFCTVSQNSEIA